MEQALAEYEGRQYRVLGRLNGVRPALGTILGPTFYEEFATVIEVDDRGCVLGLAAAADRKALEERAKDGEINSLTEHYLTRPKPAKGTTHVKLQIKGRSISRKLFGNRSSN